MKLKNYLNDIFFVMDNITNIFVETVDNRKKLELQGPNLLQNGLKPVAKPMMENVKIISGSGEIKEFIKNLVSIIWVPNNSKRYFMIQSRDIENNIYSNTILSFTKDLVELSGNILKLNDSIPIDEDNILQDNKIVITLTDSGLKKFQNMMKKWV